MSTKSLTEKQKRVMRYEIYKRMLSAKKAEGVKVNNSIVAKEVNMPRSSFSDWKNGRSAPKIGRLYRIAKYLGGNLEDFVLDEEKE